MTMKARTVTRIVETDAEPDAILEVLADARHLPQWAWGFADAVSAGPDEDWLVTKDGRVFSIRVEVERSRGTVDYVREIAPGQKGGAFLRVLPRPGGGSVVIMTLPVSAGDGDATVVAALLDQELRALVGIGESLVVRSLA
jgi:hypothetical protein